MTTPATVGNIRPNHPITEDYPLEEHLLESLPQIYPFHGVREPVINLFPLSLVTGL